MKMTIPFLCVWMTVVVCFGPAFPAFSQTEPPVSLALISPDALNKTRTDYTIFDARSKGAWQQSHLPNAVSLSWEDFTRVDEQGIPYRMLPPDRMAALLGSMGVDEKTAVAIYGDADSSWGGEGWVAWLLAYLGHQGPIVLIDGGIQAWEARKLPLNTGDDRRLPTVTKTYHPRPTPRIDMDTGSLSRSLRTIQVVDTRSFFERIRGSIPDSVHISWTRFYTGETRHPIAPEALKSLLKDNGIDPSKPVVYYCTGGVRSAYAWMVHRLSGLGPARNYEGGIVAWNKRDERP